VQLGFVIDHSRCIGCHACTVACKSENDVQLGSFRTWVKYTERGEFPEVKRSFAVLRCNQCSDAPCVAICPVKALAKRPDGIVDIDPSRCIGCKGCMQACPYDALYLNDASGTAEKCHFCAHRTDVGLAPACAVVCPTEAIVPGDFDDPLSRVSQMKAGGQLTARKTEAGTGPNVFYKEADAAGLDPGLTQGGGGYLWAGQRPGDQLDAERFAEAERKSEARTTYQVDHGTLWGGRVSAYLFTKSLAAGAFLAGALLIPPLASAGADAALVGAWSAGLAMLFLLLTTVLLVFDLKRPERFLFILRYGNPGSWLTRGAWVLSAYGALLSAWLWVAWRSSSGSGELLVPGGRLGLGLLVCLTAVAAALTAMYTAWLLRQAHGRVLWLRRGLALELLVHATLSGAALLLILGPLIGLGDASTSVLRWTLGGMLVLHVGLLLSEGARAPEGRGAEYRRAARLVTHGPFSRVHWGLGLFLGAVVPAGLLLIDTPPLWLAAALLALVGLFFEQDTLVRAGQALPIS